ncbi:MAG TPA: hypothetical protein VLW50_24845 [Streptosporangiaceae bacterium]|nr:hypothetical protein [Streptosporangiaceae bacterium]
MRWDTIVRSGSAVVGATIADYERARASWSHARAELDGLPGGCLGIAYEAAGRHAAGDRADAVAVGRAGEVTEGSYNDLRWTTGRLGAQIPAGTGERHG